MNSAWLVDRVRPQQAADTLEEVRMELAKRGLAVSFLGRQRLTW
jgi:hypothetical protein